MKLQISRNKFRWVSRKRTSELALDSFLSSIVSGITPWLAEPTGPDVHWMS